MISLNLDTTPFSRCGARYTLHRSFDPRLRIPNGVHLRHIFGGRARLIFSFQLEQDGHAVEAECSATPSCFTMQNGAGRVQIIMPDPDVIRIRTSGVGLRLTGNPAEWTLLIPAGGGRWRSIIFESKFLFVPLHGSIKVNSPWQVGKSGSHRHHFCDPLEVLVAPDSELLMVGHESEPDIPDLAGDFQDAEQRVCREFGTWLERTPEAPPEWADARAQSAYLAWSSVVSPRGHFFAPAMLMSKNWMVSAWNWDNAINAWAACLRDPDFGWNLFRLHFRHQHPTGALGDAITEESIGWAFAKPPVHAWILNRIREDCPAIGKAHLEEVFDGLVRSVEWWFRYRDDDGDGICQYHHGNDSGWDDASVFDIGSPTETPDLNALLILSLDLLGDFAEDLGRTEEAGRWRERSQTMLRTFLDHSWRGDHFVSMESGTHRTGGAGDSLLNFIPLVLGRRLPEEVRRALIAGLTEEGRFLTDWGLATESVRSPEFLQDGYWRGQIWPPPMLMVIDGLADAGETALAGDLARRYCHLVVTHGFAENHDPLTGKTHHDPAYTWAASAFQILCKRYLVP